MADFSSTMSMNAEEERALVEGLSVRDPSAVEEFVERTHRNVFAMAARLVAEPSDREDWTHDVLLQILDELAGGYFVYRWPGCFWSWFGMRVRFLLLNRLRRHRQEQKRLGPEIFGEDALAAVGIPAAERPDRLVEGVQARATIEDCIAKLTNEEHRRALTLLLFEELTYQEVADALAAPINTVRSWIRRARTAVRRCVSSVYDLAPAEEDRS